MRLDDGYSTIVEITDPISFGWFFAQVAWEKRVKPPGVSGGGGVETTTMRNVLLRTFNSKWLRTMTPMNITIAWGTYMYELLDTYLQINQLFEVWFPDTSVLTFWAFIDEFDPQDMVEGEQPEATLTVIPTNQDETGAEDGYLWFDAGEYGS